MAELGAYYITVMPDMSKFTGEVRKAMKDAGSDGGKTFSSSFADIVKGSAIGTALGNLATKAGNSIMSGLRTGIGRLDTLENFPKVMKSLGYESKDAEKSIKLIMSHLDGLPTASQDMVTLTQAISDSTGDLDLATKAALGFNDMMLANGASTAEMSNAQGVLNRVLGKGSATAAQWQSITSVMPAQLGAVAKHMLGAEASTEDLHEALENGTVSWNDFLQAIVDLDEKGEGAMDSFYEQAKANSHGIGTALENIPNRIGAGWADVIEAIGREDISKAIDTMSYGVRDAMSRIGEHITELKDKLADTKAYENFETIVGNLSERFDGLGDTIDTAMSDATTVLADFIDRALQWIVDHGDEIDGLLDKISDGFGALADVLSNAFKEAVPVLADCVHDSLQWLFDHGDVVVSVLMGIGTALGIIATYQTAVLVLEGVTTALSVLSMVSVSGGLLAFVGDLGAAFLLLAESGGILAPVLTTLGGVLTFLAANPMVLLVAAIAAVVGGLIYFFTQTETGKQMLQDFTDFVSGIPEKISGYWNDMVESTKQQWETWSTDLQVWNENVRQTISEKWEGIKSAVAEHTDAMITNARERWTTWSTDLAKWNEDMRQKVSDKWESMKKSVSEQTQAMVESTRQRWESWRTSVAEWNEDIRQKAVEKWEALGQGIVDKLEWAKEKIDGIVEWLKGIFDFEWSLPDIKLPSIDVSWTDYGFISIPSFSVNWYAKGGVFDEASIIGIGERGREAALPLNDSTYREIANGIASQGVMGGGVVITGCEFVVREDADIDRIADALSDRWMRELGATA